VTSAQPPLPSGTVTLLFTDIEGSTRLLQELGDAYATLLGDHHRIVSAAAEAHGGQRVDAAGDGLFFSFPTARGAVAAAVDAQRALTEHAWPLDADVRVRMGIHSGEPITAVAGYVGLDVHRAARICSAGHGGQILVSEAARVLIGANQPAGVTLIDLGEHRLRGLESPERLYQLTGPGLRAEFPPVRSLETLPNNLPRQLSSFVGRDHEIQEAEERLREATTLTLTGPGGVGKTRLALEIGAHLVTGFDGGVWMVELAAVDEGALVVDAVGSALRVKRRPGTELIGTLIETIADKPMAANSPSTDPPPATFPIANAPTPTNVSWQSEICPAYPVRTTSESITSVRIKPRPIVSRSRFDKKPEPAHPRATNAPAATTD
jgi:class 3 adenylate cyclase